MVPLQNQAQAAFLNDRHSNPNLAMDAIIYYACFILQVSLVSSREKGNIIRSDQTHLLLNIISLAKVELNWIIYRFISVEILFLLTRHEHLQIALGQDSVIIQCQC